MIRCLSNLQPEDRARAVAVLALLDVALMTDEALRHLARDHGTKRHRRHAAGAELARRELVDSDVESPAGGGPEVATKHNEQ